METIYQPIHPSLRPLLDPEYVAFHDQWMQFVLPDDLKVWDGTARTHPSLPAGGSTPLKVKSIVDVRLEHCQVRVFTPEIYPGGMVETKLPALLWFHGGGWAIGGLDSENDFCAYICQCRRLWSLVMVELTCPEYASA